MPAGEGIIKLYGMIKNVLLYSVIQMGDLYVVKCNVLLGQKNQQEAEINPKSKPAEQVIKP